MTRATLGGVPFRRWGGSRPLAEAAAALLLSLALLAALTVASNLFTGLLAIVLPVGVLLCALLFFNPRIELSLAALMLYVGLLDGYLKLSTGNSQLSVVRDVLLYTTVVGVLVRAGVTGTRLRLPRYGLHVLVFVLLVLVQALNPATPGLRAVFGGFKQHLEFVPLFFLGYLCMRSDKRVQWFLVLLLGITAANAVAAVVQYSLTPEQFAGWGPGYADRILGQGGFEGSARTFGDANNAERVRPFGLGSDSGASGILGWLALPGALALIAAAGSIRGRILGALGALACVIGIIAAQSRGVVIAGVFAVLVFVTLCATSREATRSLLALMVGAVLAYAAITTFIDRTDAASFARLTTLAPGQVQQTIAEGRGTSAALIPEYAARYPLGVGLGRAGPATGFGGAGSGLNTENEFNFLIGELGTVGMLVLLALWVRVLVDGARRVRASTDPRSRFLLAALVTTTATTLLVWFQASPTTGPPSAPVFWLVAGTVAWMAGTRRATMESLVPARSSPAAPPPDPRHGPGAREPAPEAPPPARSPVAEPASDTTVRRQRPRVRKLQESLERGRSALLRMTRRRRR